MLTRILLPILALGTTLAAQGLDDQQRLVENRKKKLAKPFVKHGGWLLDYDKARAKAKARALEEKLQAMMADMMAQIDDDGGDDD